MKTQIRVVEFEFDETDKEFDNDKAFNREMDDMVLHLKSKGFSKVTVSTLNEHEKKDDNKT